MRAVCKGRGGVFCCSLRMNRKGADDSVKRGGKKCVFKYACVSASVCLCEGCVQAPPSARVWHLTCDGKHLNCYNQGVSLKH